MQYRHFHFRNEIPINRFSIKWKYTNIYWILDLEAKCAGFVDKWPSRMRGQWVLQKLRGAGINFRWGV